MNILMVSYFLPHEHANHAGAVTLFHMIRCLAARHNICLLCHVIAKDLPYVDSLRNYCRQVETIVGGRPAVDKIQHGVSLVRAHPSLLLADRPTMAETRLWLQRLCRAQNFDILHVNHTALVRFVNQVPAAGSVLDIVDLTFPVIKRRRAYALSLWKRPLWRLQYERVKRFELNVIRKVDWTIARSESDKNFLLSLLPDCRVLVIPPYVQFSNLRDISPEPTERRSICFVGAMYRPENVEAILHFYYHIFPRVRQRVPDVQLYIVGSRPPSEVQVLGSDPNVTVTGFVDDLHRYYERCAIQIAPMLVGGGVQTKILDAMAAGRPVVSTAIGNIGVQATPDQEILIAETDEAFAGHLVNLLEHDDLWRRIAVGGKVFVQEGYDWDISMRRLEAVYADLVQKPERSK